MGRDKALLPFGSTRLIEHVARQVRIAAGSVTLVGAPDRYASLKLPVIPDLVPDCGPLSGIHAALGSMSAELNLIVACDMPAVSAEFLAGLLCEAEVEGIDCLLPVPPSGLPEPLCAVYSPRCLPAIEQALRIGVRKVTDALESLRVVRLPVSDATPFANLNTPAEWLDFTGATHG
jgi:molybdopterin-guanine dinucleotide biosynthesis protein A